MKQLFIVAFLALSFFGTAQANDVLQERFVFDGTSLDGNFRLSHDIQETVYEEKEVDSTCSRQVPDGFETQCHTYYENECHQEYECWPSWENRCYPRRVCRQECRRPGGCHQVCRTHQECRSYPTNRCGYRLRCHQVPRQKCEQVQKWRTEYYACKKIVRVPVGSERKLLLTADVDVKFSPVSNLGPLNEEFLLKLEGEDLVIKLLKDSGRVLLFDKINKTVETGTKLKAIRALYEVDVVGVEDVLNPVKAGLKDVRVDDESVKFTIGKVVRPDFLAFETTLKRKRTLSDDFVVFDGTLKGSELLLTDLGDRTEVTIPLNNLAANEPLKDGKKYRLSLKAKVVSPGRDPLNKQTLPGLSSSAQIEFKYLR